jgi:acyl carrier protein
VSASHDPLIAEVQKVFAERLSIDVSSPTQDLLDAGLLDSVSLVELLLELESRYGVSFPLEELDMDDFRTLTRIGALISRTGSVDGEKRSQVVPPATALPNTLAGSPQQPSGAAA